MYEEVEFDNNGIKSDKWYSNPSNDEAIAKTLFSVGLLVPLLAALFALESNHPVLLSLLCVAAILPIELGMNYLGKKIIKALKTKEESYRRDNVFTIIDGLRLHGWVIEGEDVKSIIVHDSNFYLRNENGIRYYCQLLYFGEKTISLTLLMSDLEEKKKQQENEKQHRISSLIKRQEEIHGQMADDERKGFIAGLELAL